jgi:Ca-activated chloride channel family protein
VNGLSFEYPFVLPALFLLVPAAFLVSFHYRILKKNFFVFAASSLSGASPDPCSRYVLSNVFFGLFLACLIFALAGPRWGREKLIMEYRRGLDAIFALDVSRSMEVSDVPGGGEPVSRLERGLEAARETAAACGGIRFAVVIGKGRGVAALPLTYDGEAIQAFFTGFQASSLTGRGTNLESLTAAALSAFDNSFPSRRVIILLSDGEALSGSLNRALDQARNEGVTITVLGLGSDEGGPVPPSSFSPLKAGSARTEAEAEEGGGEPLSRRRSGVLRYAALHTGGIYLDGNKKEAALLLAEHLRELAPESGRAGNRREPRSRRSLFIAAALIALGLSRFCVLKSPGAARGRRAGGGTGERI